MVIRLPEILAMYTAFQSPAITQNTLLVMYTAVQLPANTRDSTIIITQKEQTDRIGTHIPDHTN
jgi:hypothetical protein